jgi:antitoxin ParD1/3/4
MQPTSEKLSITLPQDMVSIIRNKVTNGGYASNSEVIREAMRGWMEREKRLTELDAAIAKGIADSEAGRGDDVKTVLDNFRKRLDQ